MSYNENLMPKLEKAFPDRVDRNQAILTTRIIVLEALVCYLPDSSSNKEMTA